MFDVIWQKGQSFVEKESTPLPLLEQAIVRSRSKFMDVRRRHPGNEPDGFRILDATGKELAFCPFEDPSRA
jgi:hypothetical protein